MLRDLFLQWLWRYVCSQSSSLLGIFLLLSSCRSSKAIFCISLILIGIVVHLFSHLLLDSFQDGPIYKLREGIQLLLMKQGHEVVAESPHLALSMKQRIFHDTTSWTIKVSLRLSCLLDPLLLSLSFCKGALSHTFLKEHHYESANWFTVQLRVIWALSEEDWDLVNLHHNVRIEELKPVLNLVVLGCVVSQGRFPLEWLLVDTHIRSLHNPDSFLQECPCLRTVVIV